MRDQNGTEKKGTYEEEKADAPKESNRHVVSVGTKDDLQSTIHVTWDITAHMRFAILEIGNVYGHFFNTGVLECQVQKGFLGVGESSHQIQLH